MNNEFNMMTNALDAMDKALDRKSESRNEKLDRSLLEAPWHIIDASTIIDRRGRYVATFRNEDVALLIVQLVNAIPESQVTEDFYGPQGAD